MEADDWMLMKDPLYIWCLFLLFKKNLILNYPFTEISLIVPSLVFACHILSWCPGFTTNSGKYVAMIFLKLE